MKNFFAVFSSVLTLLTAGCSTVPKSDTARLQGMWRGHEIGGHSSGLVYMIFSGDHLEYRGANPQEWNKGTFTVNQSTKPKQLTAVISECPAPQYVGKKVNAIYQIENGKLTVTGNEPGNPEVPASFDTPDARRFELEKQ